MDNNNLLDLEKGRLISSLFLLGGTILAMIGGVIAVVIAFEVYKDSLNNANQGNQFLFADQ